jgi:GTPase
VEEAGCSVILVLNKWDTQINNAEFKQGDALDRIRKQIRFMGYAPLVFTTAIEGKGIDRLFRMAVKVLEQREKKVASKEITTFIQDESAIANPENAKFYLVQQIGRKPPRFVAHVNDPDKVHFSLKRHLVNAIRDRFGFSGTPIRLELTKRT